MEGAFAIFRWKMLPPLVLRDLSDFHCEAMKTDWWPEVESDWSAFGTDTGILRLIGLPWSIVNSHRYRTLEEIV